MTSFVSFHVAWSIILDGQGSSNMYPLEPARILLSSDGPSGKS
ncbi:MAG TPA: hypothetical protein VFT44_01525 [Pyrinomonadaceae bacterium]|nr:hypothetical protein [Pyrinomonadaceae bacterium]